VRVLFYIRISFHILQIFNMKGAYVLVFVAALVLGGLAGWGYAFASGQGDKGQSKATGIGAGIGAGVGVLGCIGLAVISVGTKKGGQKNE
jgi:hypothetical protein